MFHIQFNRVLSLFKLLEQNSFFLFGPRAVGKSFLIQTQLNPAFLIDLMDPNEFTRYSTRMATFEEDLAQLQEGELVVIDEIQRLPSVLNSVHRLIERKKIKFLLTGSSARKIKRQPGINLLAGRAWEANLFPLTSNEIPDFNILDYLNRGGLPRVYQVKNYYEELHAYCNLYLKEEIFQEGLTRNLEAFSRFLEVAALQCGEELSFQNIGSDAQVNAKTVGNYFEILEDTLLGFQVPAYRKTNKRKAITRAKFYLFDIGVTNNLAKRGRILYKSELFGKAFEHFIALELRAYLSYRRLNQTLSYWRSVNGQEVDFIIGDECAIEVKSTEFVSKKYLNGLLALKEENIVKKYYLISLDVRERHVEGIRILPYKIFLDLLWQDELLIAAEPSSF